MRHTAVPGRVSDPISSQTKRYLPPAVACVRETRSVGRLHETFVASRSFPESSSSTSGVNPTHQFGGSTFVTFAVEIRAFSCTPEHRANPLQLERQRRAKTTLRFTVRFSGLIRRGRKMSFTARE